VISAWHAATGRAIWSVEMPGKEIASNLMEVDGDDLSLVDGAICISRVDWTVLAMDEVNGDPVWTLATPNVPVGELVSVSGLAFVATADGKVHAIERPAGWRRRAPA
jgi:outer membrane protein assembly factor BamB